MGIIEVENPKTSEDEPKRFTFDAVYDWNSKQRELYEETFRGLINSVLEGFNGTIFAYGQTGTGKTHTMRGGEGAEQRGVIPNSFAQIFEHISGSAKCEYLVRASYLEIYKEEIRDLLHKDQKLRLEIKEKPDTGIYVKDLSSVMTRSQQEIENVMNIGNKNRAVGRTAMNLESSRSHAIFIVTIECSETDEHGESHIRVGKLNMVDLAGSERQSKTHSEGERLREAIDINKSLLTLGHVISALVNGKNAHVPYRDSKLTRLLQDSLGGNARTIMVANIGPADYNMDETLNTLNYARRAKSIKNRPKLNEDPKDALLRQYTQEIERLKSLLGGGDAIKVPRNQRSATKKKNKQGRQKKKRIVRRQLPDGSFVDEEEEESGDEESDEEDDGANENAFIEAERRKLDAEKSAILNNRNLIDEDKQRLLNDLATKAEAVTRQQHEKAALETKIREMESKLLRGTGGGAGAASTAAAGDIMAAHTREQEQMLQRRRAQLAEQEKKEREIEAAMERRDENLARVQQGVTSLREEKDANTRMLKRLFVKMRQVRAEMAEAEEEHVRKRQEYERYQEELTREIKLKQLVVENFVPAEHEAKIVRWAEFDEDNHVWRLKPLASRRRRKKTEEKEQDEYEEQDEDEEGDHENVMQMAARPGSAHPAPPSHKQQQQQEPPPWRRPVSQFAREARRFDANPRFRPDRILQLELDMPNRTTRDYEPPSTAPQILAELDAALQEEDDLEVDGREGIGEVDNAAGAARRRGGGRGVERSNQQQEKESGKNAKNSRNKEEHDDEELERKLRRQERRRRTAGASAGNSGGGDRVDSEMFPQSRGLVPR